MAASLTASRESSRESRLVLDLHRSRACLFQEPYGLGDVVRATEARIGVDHDRDRCGSGEDPGLLDELVTGEEPDVGHAERAGGEGRPREVDRVEARVFDELCGQCERCAHNAERLSSGLFAKGQAALGRGG